MQAPVPAPDSLWDFSLALYAQPGVADCCLRLQDEQGVNVNMLLWCCWLGVQGYVLDQPRLADAQVRIRTWNANYIEPLRDLRRQMKAEFGVGDEGTESVRAHIKQAELQAERQLLYWLELQVQTWGSAPRADPAAAPEKNLHFYLHASGVADSAIAQALTVIGAACVCRTSVSQERG